MVRYACRAEVQVACTHPSYVCQTFAERFRDDGESDPEAGAAEEEAQRALDYLVCFDAGSADQPPCPLDAERLQQRLAEDQT